MPRRDRTPPGLEELGKALDRFTKQGDRGTALVAAAWLDDSLEVRIRAAFRSNKGTSDDVLEGPLGSFAARIKVAYLMGLIEPFARTDLDCIRRIRNEFAHSRTELFFKTARIKERCDELHGAQCARLGGLRVQSPKQKFIVTAVFLVQHLLSLAETEKHIHIESDGYGHWIRSTVKSASLRHLSEELAKLDLPRNR